MAKTQQTKVEDVVKALAGGRALLLESEFGRLLAGHHQVFEGQDCEPLLLLPNYDAVSEWVESHPDCAAIWQRYPMGPLVTMLRPLHLEFRRVGVAVPYHQGLRELLNETGPLLADVVPETPPPSALEVNGFTGLQHEVTVLDLSGSLRYIRQLGFVTTRELKSLLSGPLLLTADRPTPRRFTRYRPEARVVVVEGEPERVRRRLKVLRESYSVTENLLLLVSDEAGQYFEGDEVRLMGSLDQPTVYGEKLFSTLEELETEEESWIVLIEGLPRDGEGLAVMERLGLFAEKMINTENPGFSGLGVVDGEDFAGERE